MKRLIPHAELMALPRKIRAAKRSVGLMTEEGLLIAIGKDDAIDRDMKAPSKPAVAVALPVMAESELERRAVICDGCPNMKSVHRKVADFAIYSVRCTLCGTCGLRKLSLDCPDKKFGGEA